MEAGSLHDAGLRIFGARERERETRETRKLGMHGKGQSEEKFGEKASHVPSLSQQPGW